MSRPVHGTLETVAKLAQAGVKHTAIPADVDRRYRAGLLKGAQTVSAKVGWQMRRALENGPGRSGFAELQTYYGDRLDECLKVTAPIVDLCEVAMPGFKRWLSATGFGNDKDMVRAFVLWAEAQPLFKSAEKVLPAVRH